jgi:hypothetical protein
MTHGPINLFKLTVTAFLWALISRPLFQSNMEYLLVGAVFGAFLGIAHAKWGILK